MGVAQHEVKELKLTQPKLQLIISASTYAETKFFAAENVAHLDSNYRPVLYSMQNSKDQKNVLMLTNNLLENSNTLKPVEVIYPFQLYLTEQIKKIFDHKTQAPQLEKYLQELKRCPTPALLTANMNAVYSFMDSFLEKMMKECPDHKTQLKELQSELSKRYQREKELDLTPEKKPDDDQFLYQEQQQTFENTFMKGKS